MKFFQTEVSISVRGKFIFFLLLCVGLYAQESSEISREALAKGVAISLTGAELSGSATTLVIMDSAAHSLVLTHVNLNGKKVWLRQSATIQSHSNAVHWYFDEESGVLSVDLGGIGDQLTSASVLTLMVSPIHLKENRLSLALYRVSTFPAKAPVNSSPIREMAIEIKETE